MPLYQVREPFDGDDWIFEIKYDGFRAVTYIEDGCARLVSRNGRAFRWCSALGESIGGTLKCANAVLDGEIVCLGEDGRPVFNQLLYRRGHQRAACAPTFYPSNWRQPLPFTATIARALANRDSYINLASRHSE